MPRRAPDPVRRPSHRPPALATADPCPTSRPLPHARRYDTVDTLQGVHDFCERMRSKLEPKNTVTIFAFTVYFPAVATTDILCRVSDVLACKPGELAFYPVPKLMLRRVGDHEYYSALRCSEVGDGTMELREVEEVITYLDIFDAAPDCLVSMNDAILANAKIGMYDGCKVAVEMATGARPIR